jgi:hypothetical protein
MAPVQLEAEMLCIRERNQVTCERQRDNILLSVAFPFPILLNSWAHNDLLFPEVA